MSPTETFIEILVARMKENSCGAINPSNGEVDGYGYGLEIYPEVRQTVAYPTVENVGAFIRQHRDIFEKYPELRLGWDHNGRELNVGVCADYLSTASRVAANLDQRAIFDIRNGEEIQIVGSGTVTFFPEYPLEARLNDLLSC
jgi:hypothetical protein